MRLARTIQSKGSSNPEGWRLSLPTLMQSLGIDQLGRDDRLTLVQEIWDSIAAESVPLPLTDAQRRDLDRRLAEHAADPDSRHALGSGQGPYSGTAAKVVSVTRILRPLASRERVPNARTNRGRPHRSGVRLPGTGPCRGLRGRGRRLARCSGARITAMSVRSGTWRRAGRRWTRSASNLDLNGAVFHGHWQLCEFLIEHGADVNHPLPDTGETPLHSALCKADNPVVQPRPQSAPGQRRGPESRDEGRCRDRFVHAGLPNQRRDAAPPRRRVRRCGSHPAAPGCRCGHRRQGRARGHPAVVGQLVLATACRSCGCSATAGTPCEPDDALERRTRNLAVRGWPPRRDHSMCWGSLKPANAEDRIRGRMTAFRGITSCRRPAVKGVRMLANQLAIRTKEVYACALARDGTHALTGIRAIASGSGTWRPATVCEHSTMPAPSGPWRGAMTNGPSSPWTGPCDCGMRTREPSSGNTTGLMPGAWP